MYTLIIHVNKGYGMATFFWTRGFHNATTTTTQEEAGGGGGGGLCNRTDSLITDILSTNVLQRIYE